MAPEQLTSIWISPGITSGETAETHYAAGNTDVEVAFADGSRYVATCFTYANVSRLVKSYQQTGECLGGSYFWASDMLLVARIDRPSIEAVIHALLAEGIFQRVFTRVA